MLTILLIVTATFRPAQPTVGDRITIEFPASVQLDASPHYEIVSRQGSRVVVRTFEPGPLVLGGVEGGTRFDNLVLPVRSVLKPLDDLKPAPLKPPRTPPQPRGPLAAIALAALVAVVAWTAAFLLARSSRPVAAVPVAPAELFLRRVRELLDDRSVVTRWASLADATRAYVSCRGFGSELTTRQLLVEIESRAPDCLAVVRDILRQGDLEKFSPWGAPSGDFEAVAENALRLPESLEPAPAEQEAEAA